MNAKQNEVMRLVNRIARFINSTDSDDEEWLAEQSQANNDLERIKGVVLRPTDAIIFASALARCRWDILEYVEKADAISVSAQHGGIVVGRDFIRSDLDKQYDATQYMIDWFVSHKEVT